MSRVFYYRVEIFALGSLDGGCWEEDVIVSGRTRTGVYNSALDYLRRQGFAYESKITACDKEGEDLG